MGLKKPAKNYGNVNMKTKISQQPKESINHTVVERRSIITDVIQEEQVRLSLKNPIEDEEFVNDLIVNDCMNHILQKINSIFDNARFDSVFDYGLEYIIANTDNLTLEQKLSIAKELGRISCTLMAF